MKLDRLVLVNWGQLRPGNYDGITTEEVPAVQARVDELLAKAARRQSARSDS